MSSSTEQTKTNPPDKEQLIIRKTSELRQKLAEKAKREPEFKFYILYDKVFCLDVMNRLVINREKTKIVDMKKERASLDFPGYSFRFDRSLLKQRTKYLNRIPSRKSMRKARDRIRELISSRNGGLPIEVVVGQLNNFLRGWSNDFRHGYPAMAFRELDDYVQYHLYKHLHRRSQRSLRPPEGMSWYAFIDEHLKVIRLGAKG